jgi:hypothetical protein
MPNRFHQAQILMAFILALACISFFFFAPPDKANTLSGLAATLVGFVVGKFTNGFPKPARTNANKGDNE